jgi:hypothetical protein
MVAGFTYKAVMATAVRIPEIDDMMFKKQLCVWYPHHYTYFKSLSLGKSKFSEIMMPSCGL